MSIFESWKKNAQTYLPFEVFDYDTGRLLPGKPSEELIKKSGATPEGAVSAYLDDDKVWQYVMPSQKQHYKENLQEIVKTVFVIKN